MRVPNLSPPVIRRAVRSLAGGPGPVAPSDLCKSIAVNYNNGTICAKIPYIDQRLCLNIPGLPSGSGSAELQACYVFPDCVRLCVTVNGNQLPCITQCAT